MGNDFKGRKDELTSLKNAFQYVLEGNTKLVTIIADTGTGKTRLIQEFYHDISNNYDTNGYWPDMLEDTKHTMTIIPSYIKFENSISKNMPWLWLAVRCQNKDERNSDSRSDVAISQLRKQIRLHLDAIIEAKFNKKLNISVTKSLLSILANYAFPGGGGAVVEIVGQIIDNADKGISTIDAIKTVTDKLKGQKSGQENNYVKMMDFEVKNLIDQTIEVFSIIFHNKSKIISNIPIICVIDDAQWIDELTIEFINRIFLTGLQEKWPLLIINTCWETNYKEQMYSMDKQQKNLAVLIEQLKNNDLANKESMEIMELRKLPNDEQIIILNEELPNIDLNTKNFLANNCSGDLELLWDYIDRVKFMLNKKGQLSVDISKTNFLASKKKENTRERFLQLGQNIYYLLAMGSAQGIKFSKPFLEKCKNAIQEDLDLYTDELKKTDNPFNITKIEKDSLFTETAEFRRRIYYEVAREMLDNFTDKKKIMELLIEFHEETINSESFKDIDSIEKINIIEDYISLVSEYSSEKKHENLLLNMLFELMGLYLQHGFFDKSLTIGERIRSQYTNLEKDKEKALYNTMIHTAYYAGKPKIEEEYIRFYIKIEESSKIMDPQLLLHQSNYYFKYNIEEGINCATRAAKLSYQKDDMLYYRSLVQIMRLSYYSGKIKKGFIMLEKIEKDLKQYFRENYKVESSFHYTASLLFDNADLNEQAIIRLMKSKTGFEDLGDKFYYLLSSICLAHAYMGLGELEKAESEIQKVYAETKSQNWINLHGVTCYVYANIKAISSKREDVATLYRECMDVSTAIDFIFDVYCADIWFNLWRSELGEYESFENLIKLAEKSKAKGYKYLEILALTFALLSAAELSKSLTINKEELLIIFKTIDDRFPGLYVQAIAASIVLNLFHKEEEDFFIKEMLNNILLCEGIKGRPKFIMDVFELLILQNKLNDSEINGIYEWLKNYPKLRGNL